MRFVGDRTQPTGRLVTMSASPAFAMRSRRVFGRLCVPCCRRTRHSSVVRRVQRARPRNVRGWGAASRSAHRGVRAGQHCRRVPGIRRHADVDFSRSGCTRSCDRTGQVLRARRAHHGHPSLVLVCQPVRIGRGHPLADNLSANVIGLGLGATTRFWVFSCYVFDQVPTPEPWAQHDDHSNEGKANESR